MNYISFELKSKHRGIFIHVPRTGGVMMSRHVWPWATRLYMAHITASYCRDIIGKLAWDKIFTFAFVRNPWERILSRYFTYSNYTRFHKIDRSMTFEEYLNHHPMILGSVAYNGWILNDEIWSQKLFLVGDLLDDDDDPIVDFVGRFEKFDEDFGFVCDKLEIPKNWRQKNESGKKYDYHDYYTDETRKLIEKRCKWEIEKYGYQY